MKSRFIFKSILAALICTSLLVSGFAGCAQAEATTASVSSSIDTEPKTLEELKQVTLFSQPLRDAYQKAFDTYNTVDSVLQAMKDTYTAAPDKSTVVVTPLISDDTLEDELKITEAEATALGKKVPSDNVERYARWREGAEGSLLEQAQAEYDTWLAAQKAAEAEAKKAAEEEAAKKAAEEAAKKAEEEAAQQPSGGGTSGSTGSTGGGGSSGGGSDYTPPAPQPDPAPQPEPEPPAPQPDPEPDYTPPSEPSGGGDSGGWGTNTDDWYVEDTEPGGDIIIGGA